MGRAVEVGAQLLTAEDPVAEDLRDALTNITASEVRTNLTRGGFQEGWRPAGRRRRRRSRCNRW